jgi:hypothetical protein
MDVFLHYYKFSLQETDNYILLLCQEDYKFIKLITLIISTISGGSQSRP